MTNIYEWLNNISVGSESVSGIRRTLCNAEYG